MNATSFKMKVKEIMIPGNGQEVMVIGSEMRQHLTFDTHFYFDQSKLNMVINALQKENSADCISELFMPISGMNGSIGYHLDATKLEHSVIDFHFLTDGNYAYAIRA